jgi:hypothetical protein
MGMFLVPSVQCVLTWEMHWNVYFETGKFSNLQLSWGNVNFSWFIALHGHGFHDRAQSHL